MSAQKETYVIGDPSTNHGAVGLGQIPEASPLVLRERRIETALDQLHLAYDDQIELQDSGKLGAFSIDPLTAFASHPKFDELYKELSEIISGGKSGKKYRTGFRGKMFERLAHLTLSAKNAGTDKAVISPRKTFEFLKSLNPNATVTEHEAGQTSLDGIYVPDGLIVDMQDGRPRIIEVLEYTTSLKTKLNSSQVDNINMLSFSLPALGDVTFVIVYSGQDIPDEERKYFDGIAELEELSFTGKRYRKFATSMYRSALMKYCTARPEDYQTRFVDQAKRFLELEGNGGLDDAWKEFGFKHEGLIGKLRESA